MRPPTDIVPDSEHRGLLSYLPQRARDLILWFLLGATAMRGAGCGFNDIVDRDLDRKVARTRERPVASGRGSPPLAWAWLVSLCLVGLLVLLQLNATAAI